MHTGYFFHLGQTQFIDDLMKGSWAVKRGPRQAVYLPKFPNEEDTGSEGNRYYELRKRMSHYEPIINRLVNETAGLMNAKAPRITWGNEEWGESPDEVVNIEYLGTVQQDGLAGLKARMCRYVMSHARYMILLDTVDNDEGPFAQFVIKEFQSSKILDGDQDPQTLKLQWVLLDESTEKFDDVQKVWYTAVQWRVLGLDSNGKYYSCPLYGDQAMVEAAWKQFNFGAPPEEAIYPQFKGDTLDFIPGVVCNLSNHEIQGFEDPPFLDVGETSIEAYNLSSLYVNSLQKNSNATLVAINVDRPSIEVDTGQKGPDGKPILRRIPKTVVTGGAMFLNSSKTAQGLTVDVKMLETSGNGLKEIREAYLLSLQSMSQSSLNGILEAAGANSSAEALKLRSETGTAAFGWIDKNISRAIEQVLYYAAQWAGATEEEANGRISYVPDTSYIAANMSLGEVIELIRLNQELQMRGQGLADKALHEILVSASDGRLPSYEENRMLLEEQQFYV